MRTKFTQPMKKSYFFLLCLLVASIFSAKAQPETTAPNPVSGVDYPKVFSIYGPYEKAYNFSTSNSTITPYGDYGMKVFSDSYGNIYLNQNFDLGTAPYNYKKLYFVYYGDLNKV